MVVGDTTCRPPARPPYVRAQRPAHLVGTQSRRGDRGAGRAGDAFCLVDRTGRRADASGPPPARAGGTRGGAQAVRRRGRGAGSSSSIPCMADLADADVELLVNADEMERLAGLSLAMRPAECGDRPGRGLRCQRRAAASAKRGSEPHRVYSCEAQHGVGRAAACLRRPWLHRATTFPTSRPRHCAR